jgi:hypothetical protein
MITALPPLAVRMWVRRQGSCFHGPPRKGYSQVIHRRIAVSGLVGNRTINDMITSGGPDRADAAPAAVAKGVAKPACPATGPAPFFAQSRGVTAPPPVARSPGLLRLRRHVPYWPLAAMAWVHCLVDAEDLRQPGDPEDLQYPLLRADQVQRAVVRPSPFQALSAVFNHAPLSYLYEIAPPGTPQRMTH